MTPQPPAPQEPAQPFDPELRAAGQLASPTWELELFLSGALVFATFKLPGVVDAFFSGLEPHIAGTARPVVINLALYSKAIAYTLLLTFTIHLIGRAQWVALIGLQSVYAGGIDWSKVKMGPLARELYRARTPALAAGIAKLDNFCSVVFSVGMLFVLLFIYSATLLAAIGGLGWLFARMFTGGEHVGRWAIGFAAVFVVIPVASGLVDKYRGDRLVPGSPAYRVVHAMLRFTVAVNLTRIAGPVIWTLMGNVGRTKATAIGYLGLMAMISIATADQLARRGSLSVNGYDYFGLSLRHSVLGGHYENQRPANTSPRMPMIQSDMIRDPYVKLFIPYLPDRHNASLARECPGLVPLQSRGVQVGGDDVIPDSLVTPALACLARLHAVTLDGVARPDLDFSFYQHPATGLRGVLAYIPVDSLARGRHVITVKPSPPATLPTDSTALANARWKEPYVIPFWK